MGGATNHVPVLVGLGKGVAGKPVEKAGLANTRVADHQHLEAVEAVVSSGRVVVVRGHVTNGSCAAPAMVNEDGGQRALGWGKSLARMQDRRKCDAEREKKRPNEKKKPFTSRW